VTLGPTGDIVRAYSISASLRAVSWGVPEQTRSLPGTEISFVRFLDGRADLPVRWHSFLDPASAGLFFGSSDEPAS
jgi:hypothetical protein